MARCLVRSESSFPIPTAYLRSRIVYDSGELSTNRIACVQFVAGVDEYLDHYAMMKCRRYKSIRITRM